MPRRSVVVDVFLSSPSDVDAERDIIVGVAQEWNLLRSRDTACYVNIITWQDIIAPALSDRPQAIINEQIGDDYDVYLGLMWSKLGSPTGSAESGTVEEFDRALDRFRGGESIRLAMLFKTSAIPTRILNGAQFDRVNAFKQRFAEEGGIYREFQTDDELRGILNRLFEQIAQQARISPGDEPSAPLVAPGALPAVTEKPENEKPTATEDLTDIGILDLNEQLATVVNEQGKFLDGWTEVLQSNTEESRSASQQMEDLTRFGSADPSALRPIMSRMSANLDQLSKFVEDNIDGFIKGNDKIIALTEAGLDISNDFHEQDETNLMKSSVVELLSTLVENKSSLETLIHTSRKLPRMTTESNKAKKRAIKAEETMLSEIERLRQNLSETLSSFDSAGRER